MLHLQPHLITLDLRSGTLRVRYQIEQHSEKFTGVLGTGEVAVGDSPEVRKAVEELLASVTRQINTLTGTLQEEPTAKEDSPEDDASPADVEL